MNRDLRFVFDTNVIISAALVKTSASRQALDMASMQGKILLSWPTIAELQEVLSRKRFDQYVTQNERMLLLAVLVRDALLIEPTEKVMDCRDPEDNKFLEVAVNGKATCIVSGDHDLLVLHPFRGIPVLTPRDFLNQNWGVIA
jgi:hypothetical protein